MKNLNGLHNINYINGNLDISENASLIDLSGLENLNSINGHLRIANNPVLEDLIGIRNLEPESIGSKIQKNQDMIINTNPNLFVCDVKSICDFLDLSGKTTDIFDNAFGCQNEFEIEEKCADSSNIDLIVFPNPFLNNIEIDFRLTDIKSAQISIWDINGKIVEDIEKLESDYFLNINTGELNSGMYILQIKTKNLGTIYKKIVKVNGGRG